MIANSLHCSESSELYKQLREIIEKSDIRIVFQSIVSLRDGSVLGYEALSRGPVNTPLQNPDALFGVATECGMLWDLEQLCRTKALEAASRYGREMKLFLNVNPYVIHDEKFKSGFTKEYLMEYRFNPENIFFEITEKSAVSDLDGFKKAIEHYKKQNYKIAIDDAGAGYSGLNMITDIHPHYIKLDMNLIRGIDRDSCKKALVKSLYEFSRVANIFLIAEGIETEEEMDTLIDIGIQFAQGYYIQKPDSRIKEIEQRVLDSIQNRNAQKNHMYYYLSSIYIGNLCTDNVTVSPRDTAAYVYDLFLGNSMLSGVTVVDSGGVAGMVTRTRIDHIMSGQFGYSLHSRRPISFIMDESPLVTDFQTPIDTVSKLAMSRSAGSLYDFIIVTKDRKYYGIVTIKDLLEKAMEIEVSNARHQNPLSGLPGNLIIERHLTRCIASAEPFTVLYIDLDNFKAYNDVYGFENGDNVIRFVATLLKKIVPDESFIGHVGGDDFIAILSSYEATNSICTMLLEEFDRGIRHYYSEKDLNRGFIIAKNRKGEEDQFPVMTISIAGISNRTKQFEDIYQLSEYAGTIKKRCKQVWESCYRTD